MEEYLLTEKYRPRIIDDCVLPDAIKTKFKAYIEEKQVPNLLLVGTPGVGKTTIARALLNEMNANYIVINGSLDRNIDTLRNDIASFASAMSTNKTKKFVIIDEADNLNQNSMQLALRAFMEEFSSVCGFIFTCNNQAKIIEALRSRCTTIKFDFLNKEVFYEIAPKFLTRLQYILNIEQVQYDNKVLAKLIQNNYPDFRKIINIIQGYKHKKVIDTGILAIKSVTNFEEIVRILLDKDYDGICEWIYNNADVENAELVKYLFERREKFSSIKRDLVLILADYNYKSAFVTDKCVNNIAMLTEIMVRL